MAMVDENSKEKKTREKVPPTFQALLIFISACILTISFYMRMESFRVVDEPIDYKPITPQVLKSFGGISKKIAVGLQIEHFKIFDVTNNKFEFTGNLWFEFDAGTISLDTLNQFEFERGNILYRSPGDIKFSNDQIRVLYLIKVQFNTGLNYSDFPFDDHQINIVLIHPFISPQDIILETKATDLVVSASLLPFGWNLRDKKVKSGYNEYALSESDKSKTLLQPLAGFAIKVERYGPRYILAILLPIILLYLVMFFSLSVDHNPSVTICLGCITGILAYRYVIEQLSPSSAELMFSDHFFFMILTSALLLFLLNKLDLSLGPLSMAKKKLYIVCLHAFTTIATITLLIT